jgi:hypothetical protein
MTIDNIMMAYRRGLNQKGGTIEGNESKNKKSHPFPSFHYSIAHPSCDEFSAL